MTIIRRRNWAAMASIAIVETNQITSEVERMGESS
jgi:hypothetical protein